MAQVNPEISTPTPAVSTRRHFLSQAAGVAASGAVLSLATNPPAAAMVAPSGALASPEIDPIFALISRHRAEEQAYEAALMARDELDIPEEFNRPGRVQFGMTDGRNPHFLLSQADRRLPRRRKPTFPQIQGRATRRARSRQASDLGEAGRNRPSLRRGTSRAAMRLLPGSGVGACQHDADFHCRRRGTASLRERVRGSW